MSDLTQFRDHARFMAGREHALGCLVVRSKPPKAHSFDAKNVGWKWCGNNEAHDEHAWKSESQFGSDYAPEWRCAGICGGCNSDAHRALWSRLADEIDAYLADDDETPLWEEEQ
ncbi:hypothetical protein EFK50_07760 [Nocardioides marmoriginsengisoli]|uniref:Uncharacterized protein n=1 Tax=Nocardioides marmoriginsengisoli TaxID=661483 RepID=A0A3N0CJK4_9ACTN|nr:hypothetical protein [Nocardioides marmoriginsengisoli]RNL63630.1 hypothetical protein EFK50_07760 [Nocardioides marmoriginsengisoli]